MLLSIIIINYNTFQLTCDCIRSIVETANVEYEIILVDNNSTECSPKEFCKLFPNLHLVALNENIGFGRANNLGVEKSKGKYVLLLNSDTIVQQNTIDETVTYLERHSEVDILGCKVLYVNNDVQQTVLSDERENELFSALKYLIKRNTFFVETRLFIHNKKQKRILNKKSLVDANGKAQTTKTSTSSIIPNYYNGKRIGALVGVFLLLKRSVFIQSKGFDPDFFMYYEEIEWFVKRMKGFNIVYYPLASVVHYQRGSDIHKKMDLQFFVSQHLFWYKMGFFQYIFYLFSIFFEIPSRLLVSLIYKKTSPSRDIPNLIMSLPYFFNVLRYSNRFGARRKMLKLAYLKKKNL